jgi:tape measure domain-containing protein
MATEAFVIAISSTGTRQVQRDLTDTGAAGTAAAKSIDAVGSASTRAVAGVDALRGSLALMRNMLVAMSFVRAVSGIVELGNEAALMQNKIITITNSTEEMRAVMEALAKTSVQTRTDLDTNVDTFVRMARSTGLLHLSYQQLINLTRGIADTVHIAGASTQQAKRALMDFAEGLAAGSLQGRQLRAMIMQLPTLGDAIGKSFGLAGAQLMEFLKTNPGQLSPINIIKSLEAALPGLDAMINKTQNTMGQAFTNLHTKLILYVQGLDGMLKISDRVNTVLGWMGDHSNVIGKFLVTMGAIAALSVTVHVITALATSMGFLGGVINILLLGLPKLAFNLLMLPFRVVAGLVGLLQAAFTLLATTMTFVTGVVKGVQAAFIAMGAITTLVLDIMAGVVTLTTVWTLLAEGIAAVVAAFVTALPAILAVGAALLFAGGAILGFLAPLAQLAGLADPFKGMKLSIADIPQLFEAAFDTLVNDFPLVTQALSAIWNDMINGMMNGIHGAMFKMVSFGIKPSEEAWKWATGYKDQKTDTATPLIHQLGQRVADRFIASKNPSAGDAAAAAAAQAKLLSGSPNVVVGKDLDVADPGKVANATAALEGFLKQFSNYAAAQQKMAEFDKLVVAGGKAKIDVLRLINEAGIHATSIAGARVEIERMVLREVVGVGNAEFKATQELAQLNQARDHGILVNNEYARSLLKISEARLTANPTDTNLGISVAKQKADVSVQATGTIGEGIVSTALGVQNQEALAAAQTDALSRAQTAGIIHSEGYAVALEDVQKSRRTLEGGEAAAQLHAQNELLNRGALAAGALSSVYTQFYGGDKVAAQIGAINDAVSKNPALMALGNKAIKEISISYLKTQRDMDSGELVAALESQETATNNQALAATALAKVYDQMTGPQKFATQIAAINDAMAKNPALMEEGVKAVRDLQIAFLSTQEDALSGFQKGILETQKSLSDFASTAANTVVTAFSDMQEAMTGFFMTGKMSIKSFAEDLQKNLVKGAVQQTITSPLADYFAKGAQGQGGVFGSGGMLGTLFGGTGLGGMTGAEKLGSSAALPMYVTIVQSSLDALSSAVGSSGSNGSSGGGLSGLLGSIGGVFSSSGSSAAGSESGLAGISGLFNGAMSSGALDTSSSALDMGSLMEAGSMFGFATGGDGVVGGQGGTDSKVVSFRATPGELVSVRRPGDDSGQNPTHISVQMNVMGAQDPDTFRRSQGQMISTARSAMQRASARSGN